MTLIIIALVVAAVMLAVGMLLSMTVLVSLAMVVAVAALVLGIVFKLARRVLGCSGFVVLLIVGAFAWHMFLR